MIVIFGGYFPAIFLIEQYKFQSGDRECNIERGNGISGHSFYITWSFLILWYLTQVLAREIRFFKHHQVSNTSTVQHIIHTWVTLLVLPVAAICLGIQGFFSYYYGYHSLQQIFIGSLLGVIHTGLTVAACEFAIWSYFRDITHKRK